MNDFDRSLLTASYQHEMWTVRKDDIYSAISAVDSGIQYLAECLAVHDANLGRTTPKNKWWAEQMEDDLRKMKSTLELLRSLPSRILPDAPKE